MDKIELIRVLNPKKISIIYNNTKTKEQAAQLEILFKISSINNNFLHWHKYITCSFKHQKPLRIARFRPAQGRNIFYSSIERETALYEAAYHIIKERQSLRGVNEAIEICIFGVNAASNKTYHIDNESNKNQLIDKQDYTPSHCFINQNPHINFLYYPSCRDPKNRKNAAIFDINLLGKNPNWELPISHFYDYSKQQLTWIEDNIIINWTDF